MLSHSFFTYKMGKWYLIYPPQRLIVSSQSVSQLVQFLSSVWLCNPMACSIPGFPVHHLLPKLAQTYVHRVGDAIQPSHPLFSPSPPVFNLSQHQGLFQALIQVLCIRWPKYWSFSISPSNEYSGLISFRIVWFDLLAVWGTLKSLLQHHNLKASILQHSAFFMVQLSHPYMNWKNHSFGNMNLCQQSDIFTF